MNDASSAAADSPTDAAGSSAAADSSAATDFTAAPPAAPIRVLIADDHAAIRAGLRLMLDVDGIKVVGEAADGATAVRNTRLLRPDVVLMDIRMPGMDGIEATATITREGPAEVLVLTTFDLDDYVRGALMAGAVGFLLKSTTANALVDAVRERDVLACLGLGQSNLGIARSLGISESTAKTHVSRLLAKLEVTSRMQAAVVAREAGLDRVP
jgi:DNA-binding NarL/FixJ family response regulator